MKTPNFCLFLAAAFGLATLAGCTPATQPRTKTSLALKECRVPNVDTAVQCATFDVFENRATKTGRKIALNIVVYPASARVKEPDPIMVFAGGPGQAATDMVAGMLPILQGLTTKRDVIFIDQRGTGKSNGLTCQFPSDDSQGMVSPTARRAVTLKLVAECRDKLAARADLTRYGTTEAMADYDAVRAALGIDKLNLWGGSYGSRTAQEYLRRYPNHVRSMVLDGVASPSMALPATFARDAGAALDAAFSACDTDVTCRTNYPDVRSRFAALLTRLENRPEVVSINDPVTNLPRKITVTRLGISMRVFSMLYAPQLVALLPEAINAAERGQYAPLYAMSGGFTKFAEEKIALGMRLSVSCNEDVPRIDAAVRAAADKIQPFQSMFIQEFANACESWPTAKVAADFFLPVQSDKPVLILSGGLDPVTPASFGDEVSRTFPNSVHLIAPHVGHGVARHGCAPRLVKQFIDKASVAGLDGTCLKQIPRPMFYQAMREKPKPNGGSNTKPWEPK